MNILSIYYTHKPGGFCRRLYRLLSALAARGHSVHYLTLDPPPASLSNAVTPHIIPFPTRKRSGLLFWGLFLSFAPIYVVVMAFKLRPKRIVAFNPFYAAVCAPARFLSGAKLILFLRSLVFKINALTNKPTLVQVLSNFVDRLGIFASDTVVCMTEDMKKDLSAFFPSNSTPITILPNDLPTPDKAFEPAALPEGQFVILSSGVIDERKNVGLLVNAFALLLKQNLPDHVLLFAGSGPLAEHYKGLVASFGVTNVQFLGWQESLIPYLKRAQMVLHPSFHEGMPNSVMEALAYDRPVLLSDTPELRELIFYDELLFDPYNAEALAQRLAPLIRDRSLLAPLLELSRKRSLVYSFDWDERASQIVTQ